MLRNGPVERRVVLRRCSDPTPWTAGLVEREAAALAALVGSGVTAPRLLGTDATGDHAGVRCLLMTEVAGQVVLSPADLTAWLDALARTQSRLHETPPVLAPSTRWRHDPGPDLTWITDAGLRRDALAVVSGRVAEAAPVFTHGDYQHFNVLWLGDHVSGVVDGTGAGTGPRGTDVGHCRLNVAVLFSADAADRYLAAHEQASGVTVDPRADLRALMGWDPRWRDFIPRQVAGRAVIDLDGMADRVVTTIRRAMVRVG